MTGNMNTTISAINHLTKRMSTHGENMASAGVTGGRTSSYDITSSMSTQNDFSLNGKRICYIDKTATDLPSDCQTNFSVNGDGMPVVDDGHGIVGFCRNGTFSKTSDNRFKNSDGQYLKVILVDQYKNPLAGQDVNNLNSLKVLDLTNVANQQQATSKIQMSAQLPASFKTGESTPASDVEIINSLGVKQMISVTWTKSASDTFLDPNASSKWTVSVSSKNGGTIGAPYLQTTSVDTSVDPAVTTITPATMTVEFDSSGKVIGYYDSAAATPALTPASAPPALTIAWPDGSTPSSIELDLGAPGSSDLMSAQGNSYKFNNILPDGYVAGVYQDFEFDEQGYGTILYTNGNRITFCRVPLARFNATNSLTQSRTGVYTSNKDTGPASLHFPGEGGTGTLKPGRKEGSTVDPTQVYLNMIKDQSDLTGNYKVVTILKQMNDELMHV
jgi:flagellar hook protein FlgE